MIFLVAQKTVASSCDTVCILPRSLRSSLDDKFRKYAPCVPRKTPEKWLFGSQSVIRFSQVFYFTNITLCSFLIQVNLERLTSQTTIQLLIILINNQQWVITTRLDLMRCLNFKNCRRDVTLYPLLRRYSCGKSRLGYLFFSRS